MILGTYTLTDAEESRVADVQRLATKGSPGIAKITALLTDPSWVVRRAVVEALASIGEPAIEPVCNILTSQRDNEARIAAAVDTLVAMTVPVDFVAFKLAENSNPAVVADAAQILGRRRSQAGVPVLIQLTKHTDDNVAVGAIEALGRIGGRAAVEALVEAVATGNFFRTFPAIDVLGRSGDPRAIEPLIQLLDHPSYLPEAARALGRSGERAAVKPLLELLKSTSDATVRVAAIALWDLRERFQDKSGGDSLVIDQLIRNQVGSEILRRLTHLLSGTDVSEAIIVCHLLGAIGSAEAAPQLAVALDFAEPVATAAADALKKIGKGADESLSIALREGSSARRKILLPVVTRFTAAGDIAKCLLDPDREVRALACEALSRIGNASVVPLIFPLLSDTNLRVVHAATAAIQALGTREARVLAIEAAKSPNAVVRRSALRILAYFGDNISLSSMIDGLKDEDARVREAALQGLPYLESPAALEALLEATKSPLERTRALAMRSLGQVPKLNERGYSLLLRGLVDPDAWVRYYACQSMGRLQYVDAVPEITKLLRDEAGQVRVSAVEALSHLDSQEAHKALRAAAISSEIEVKRAALVGLGISHRAEDLPVVLSAANDPDIPTRLMALSALVSFTSHLVIGAFSSAASESDGQVSSTAIKFLAARPEQEATEILVDLLAVDSTKERAKMALLVPADGRVSGLLVVLESANDDLAPELVSILSRIERPEAKVGLLAAMKLGNVAARKAAASGLAARRDKEMVLALREAAQNDPDSEVRHICSLLLHD
jgi:HEAT repeat protein